MIHRPFPAVLGFAVALGLAGSIGACGGSTPPPPPPLVVTIDGTRQQLDPGSTYGSAKARFGLRASDGRLLSVSGDVLDAHSDPGLILLNGSQAPPTTRLRRGDAIRVLDGRDRTEPTRRIVVRLPQPSVADPERTLTVYRMRQVTVEGRLSGEIVSIRMEPRGRGRTPKAVALTFDDGPWPGATERVLAILERFGVKATFFMVGSQAERYPNLVKRVNRAGHSIGNHTFDHPVDPLFADMTDLRTANEIDDADEVLARQGIHPTLFRPPGGSFDAFVVQEALRRQMRVVMWSVDPQDWRAGRTAKEIVKKVLRDVHAGSIILLHDGGGDAEHTIKALPDLIRGIRKMGLGFVTVPA
jgi:peptidoglycan/xylan/chitin deacetylase (PgdA/CDA1 family)